MEAVAGTEWSVRSGSSSCWPSRLAAVATVRLRRVMIRRAATASVVAVALVAGPAAAWAAPNLTSGRATAACATSQKDIAADLRGQDAYPVVRGMKAREVAKCRGKWAVVTRTGMGDMSFNARYAKGRWRFNAGYPMGACGRAPSWLCPSLP